MRIVIVEDNSLLLENLRLLLQGEPGVRTVMAFTSAEEALRAAPWAETDILLADLELPGMSGEELIAQVKAKHPAISSMAYTIYEDRERVFAAIKAGACGYILKGSSPRELIEALRELHAGGAPMSPKVARKVILQFQQQSGAASADAGLLSAREQEVLKRLDQGQSYKDIALAMNISRHTVHSHIKHIYEKVQAESRGEAIRKARQRGLL